MDGKQGGDWAFGLAKLNRGKWPVKVTAGGAMFTNPIPQQWAFISQGEVKKPVRRPISPQKTY